MMYTQRADGLDDPKPTKRGPSFRMNQLLGIQLRTGFMLQLTALAAMVLTYSIFGGRGLLTYDLSGVSEDARLNHLFKSILTGLFFVYMLGSLSLMVFQTVSADDTCWARGYRTGSKLMKLATFLDACTCIFQMAFFIYMLKFYSTKTYTHYLNGGPEQLIVFVTQMLRAFSLFTYAASLYLYEVYHDEGAGDIHGYVNGALYLLAGYSAFVSAFTGYTFIPVLLHMVALVSGTTWSFFFEPEVNIVSPALHETELTNEVEEQVEQFAKYSNEPQSQGIPSYAMSPGGRVM